MKIAITVQHFNQLANTNGQTDIPDIPSSPKNNNLYHEQKVCKSDEILAKIEA